MQNKYQEYFRGNKQEIEKEQQKKRALMSFFPKTLGTVDGTKYVLIDDDKPQSVEFYDDNAASALSSAIISNDSEKSKDGHNEQISWIPSFYDRENVPRFDRLNEYAAPLNQESDNDTASVPTNSFAFANNKQSTNRNPFAPNPQLQGLDTWNDRLKPYKVENDSLNLSKNNGYSDFTCRANGKSNTNINQNNVSSTQKKALLIRGKLRTNEYAEQVDELKKSLPTKALDILNRLGVNVEVVDNLFTINSKGEFKKKKGIYAAENNCIIIDSKHVDEYTLISEVFHAAQDYLGMTGSGKSNLEFQEHVIKDLYNFKRNLQSDNYENINGFSTTDDNEYDKLISGVFDENNVLDLNKFLPVIESYFDEFQKYYSPSGVYQEPGIENFDYNWIELLDLFGIEYK